MPYSKIISLLFPGRTGLPRLGHTTRRHFYLVGLTGLATLTGGIPLLIGCAGHSTSGTTASTPVSFAVRGIEHGGQQPITGAMIQLYAAGTTGDGSAATPLLQSPVQTDSSGSFEITSQYTCPSATAEVYLTASGGNPGLPSGENNPASVMMAALGQCGSLTASTFISVNEVTTIGSLAALYPYVTSISQLGSGSSDAAQLADAFALVNEYVNTATGTTPGPALPDGSNASSLQIDALGDILATCVNSSGGVAGDGSPCGNLFSLATPQGSSAPIDIFGATLNILNNPSQNVTALFNLIVPNSPFQPALSAAPTSWALPIVPASGAPTISSFSASPSSIMAGQPSVLSWTTTNATSLTIDEGVGSVTGATSTTVYPSATTTYTLTASNSAGTNTAQVAVIVSPDTQPASVPTNLTVTGTTSSSISLSWTASTDPIYASSQLTYNVFRDGTEVATTVAGVTSYQDTGLAASTTYGYTVDAYDPAGNLSAQSSAVQGTTDAQSSEQTYSTNFPLTENPISENGNWVGGQSAGGNLWGNIQTASGSAFGVSDPTKFGDSTAILTGTWSPTQSATATTAITETPTGNCCHEVEVRLRMNISPGTITGYEVYCSVMPSPNNYCHIATWGGPNGSYDNLTSYTGPLSTLVNGDVLEGTVTGSNPTIITGYVNGTAIMQVTDTGQAGWGPWTSGNPGIGFYDDQDNLWSDFAFNSFTATGSSLAISPPGITSFSASPANIMIGDTSTLSWSVTNADSVSIAPGTFSASSLTGSLTVNPATSTTYTLTATNENGTATATTVVSIGGPP